MKKEKQNRHCKNHPQISSFSILWRVRERAPVGKGLATQARGSEFSLKHPHRKVYIEKYRKVYPKHIYISKNIYPKHIYNHRKVYPKRWCVLVSTIPVLGRQKQEDPWGPVTDSPSLSAALMFHWGILSPKMRWMTPGQQPEEEYGLHTLITHTHICTSTHIHLYAHRIKA